MKAEHRVFLLSIILIIALWSLDAFLHHLSNQGALPFLLDPNRAERDLFLWLISIYVLVFGIVTAITIARRRRAEKEREELISQLQEALKKIKTLRGLLPICANCKRIRDDQGYWRSVEAYIREHSDVEFTHGLCPDCLKKLYPDHPATSPSSSGEALSAQQQNARQRSETQTTP